MMIRWTIVAGALTLAACNQVNGNQSNSEAPVSTTDLLKQGSAQVCSQQDVRDTMISQIKPKDSDLNPGYNLADFQTGKDQLTYNIDTIALAGVDKSINSVSCDGNLIVHFKDHQDKTFSIRYTVRPSVEDANSFIVNLDATDAASYAALSANMAGAAITVARDEAKAQADAQAQAQAAQQDTPTADQANSTGQGEPSSDAPSSNQM